MTENMKKQLKPGVSAVVCCYNSSKVIEPTIKALSEQNIPENIGYEVILVDNNCTDDTVISAQKAWGNGAYPLRIVSEEKSGLIYARKRGVISAKYEILLFVDDDNILSPDWIEKLCRLYEQMPDVGAIAGYNEALIHGEKPGWFEKYKNVYACGPRDIKSGRNPKKQFGAGMSFRTAVIRLILFSDLPLFLTGRTKNILSRGEDTEMALRCRLMGWIIYYDSSLKLKHNLLPHRINWDYVCRARKGGGAARIIFNIYKNLLEGKKPLGFLGQIRYVVKCWAVYFLKNITNIFYIRSESYERSFEFYWLVGMLYGLSIYRKDYAKIRKQIEEYF